MAVQIPTKRAALQHVAGHIVSEIQAGNIIEMSGLDESSLTRAEISRLEWAMEDISRRLLRVARPETMESEE